MIFFISDTHFCHKNIIKYCNRPFRDVKQMNETLIKNWNEIVKEDDVIYHLGDIALGRKEVVQSIISKLNGKKLLIRGNHDTLSVVTYEDIGFEVLKNPPIFLDEYKIALSHVPIPDNMMPEDFVNVHGHIHNKKLYDCIESYDPKRYSEDKHFNISCDTTDFKPISIEQLKQRIESIR